MAKRAKSQLHDGARSPGTDLRTPKASGLGDGPIAVVGMACRFPGAENLPDFWHLLDTGASAVTHGAPGESEGRVGEMFPDDVPVHDASRFGAFLAGIDQFDAEFFRISPLEAQSLDPQQRLLLEMSWEALEDAGIDPARLVGSRSGVYVGIGSYEYQEIIRNEGGGAAATPLYFVTGNRFSTASGRISFALGLEGPSIAVDTACSSSLVALHHAVAGLQRGEADLALAGGVCVILSPLTTEAFANAGMLSPTGRCWTFDERADGFVRSEGCGMLVLRRLDEAEAAGDRIWGVVHGSAVNQDGIRQGLPAPKGLTQQRVIEEALSRAGIGPSQVDYLEAHGTGTRLGDPTEVNAATAVYARGRSPDRPLLMGSVKTNIGHLAAAAGVAGLIKVLLSMRRGVIPRHLNLRNPNPEIDWDRLPVRVTTSATDWPRDSARPPLAGVSSFGFSGTNSHVVVGGYEAADEAPAHGVAPWPTGAARRVLPSFPGPLAGSTRVDEGLLPRELRILPLSGKSSGALRDLAGRYLEWLDECAAPRDAGEPCGEAPLADLAWTAGVGRSHFAFRAGLAFRDAASLRNGLQALASAKEASVPRAPAKVAFAYTGQASQWTGMGLDLYEREPVVRAVLDRCDTLLGNDRGASLLDVMFDRAELETDLDEPKWKQPAIYALECALAALWSSIGIRPDVVFGHSLGEIAAAQAAGVFGLEDGLRIAAARGALIGALPGAGAMAAVFAPPPRVQAALDEHNAGAGGAGVCIAAYNGAHQVLSGPEEDIEVLVAHFESEQIRARRLRKSPAYHSAMIEPALDDLEAVISRIEFSAPEVPFVSNLTGGLVGPDDALDASYWRRQAREPVAFRACVETLAALGVDTIVEIGPHAVLGPMALLAWPEPAHGLTRPPVTLSSLRRPSESAHGPAGGEAFVEALARGYESGLPIDFEGLFAGEARRRISLPSYPFQRRRHWFEAPKRCPSRGHRLLGVRHESPRGEVTFETEMFASDPAWVKDHLVFGQIVVPGAMFAAMAATVLWGERARSVVLEDCQLHSPMILPKDDPQGDAGAGGRKLQIVFDGAASAAPRRFEVFSQGSEDGWSLHLEGRMSPDGRRRDATEQLDLERLASELVPGDVASLYRNKVSAKVVLGPAFRSLQAVWSGAGEALGEVTLPDCLDGVGLHLHPILLDGCFQTVLAARDQAFVAGKSTYMPFGWDRLWLAEPPPERIFCHVRMRETARRGDTERSADASPEIVKADLRLYAPTGEPLGGVDGFTMKRATRATMLSASKALKDLVYEVAWRERSSSGGAGSARFLEGPETIRAQMRTFPDYLEAEGVRPEERGALLEDLDRLCGAHVLAALDRLGWRRRAGAAVDPEALCGELGVVAQHRRLFARLLGILAEAGVLKPEPGGGLTVVVGSEGRLPDEVVGEPASLAERLRIRHQHGSNELALLERCGGALAEVLQGRADPLSLLFGSDGPGAADLYRTAPAARAANRMLAEAVRAAVAGLPEGRRLRVLEVGAGTGSATEPVLAQLPAGRFDYLFTDISAGFFAEAESRFAASAAPIEYRALDIEADPVAQGFDSHGYDLVVAANVLHTTRDLADTLAHCRSLLAPRGQLVALELVRGRHLQDLTFGMLDGWWRFSDRYRPDHPLADPAVWRRAFSDAGFAETEVLGVDACDGGRPLGPGIIVARGPEEVALPPGVWIMVLDCGGVGEELAETLAARNQTVVIASEDEAVDEMPAKGPGVFKAFVQTDRRESWRSLVEGLPDNAPLQGVVHLAGLDGHGECASTEELACDVRRAGATALSLVQGLLDAGATPAKGLCLVTRGAQVLERERGGEIAGAALWGFGKALAREAPHLATRMIDLDPEETVQCSELADELLFPGAENHIAFRRGAQYVARLVRTGSATARIAFPDDPCWRLAPDEDGALDKLRAETVLSNPLEPGEVRVAVEAAGLNFWDVLRASGALEDGLLGREMCGRVVEAGPDASGVSVGDRVVGLAFGTFAREVVTLGELVAPAPDRMPAAALATVPVAFSSAALAFDLAGLKAGERVLIHAGAGGVGLAAVQLAHATGAEVFATASATKRAYLRSLGVSQVFDSRQTAFGREILEATAGAGVHVVLNSLTGPGFVEASLDCLAPSGRFVELGARGIWSEAAMSAARPDVDYAILQLGVLKGSDPARPGAALRNVMDRIAAGELSPLPHRRWPLAEAASAMAYMRSARHIGKIVLSVAPLTHGRLREDRTYLVTGGLGGIGCAVAGLLADRGARVIVLNGRRAPDAPAEDTIRALKARGVKVRVELADIADGAAVDAMLARMDADLPPLAGVIHSVGVLSDGALANQSWERFERVLWPKVLGAWHLHRATQDRDLDLFILFSSVAGILGSAGQVNHAAANAFLDQLAAHRRARGLPGQAIAWGAWSEIGEAEEQRDRIEEHIAARGVRWITPQQGLRTFEQLVAQDLTAATVTAVDWSVYAQSFATGPTLLEELLTGVEADADRAAAAPENDLLFRLRQAPAAEREDVLTAHVLGELQAVLRLSAPPSPTARFFDLGMDSLMAVELRNRLNRGFAGSYVASNTVVFDYPDTAALARFLAGELGELGPGDAPATPAERAEPPQRRMPDRRPVPSDAVDLLAVRNGIAIVGMACRLPGATDIAAFWNQLETGADAITDGRRDDAARPDLTADPGAKDAVHRYGGFVEGIDEFDAWFFGIRPIEARTMDPQQRMLLETSWQALEDAGMDPGGLRGSRTGVYVGVSGCEYRDVMTRTGAEIAFLGTAGSVAAGRIAFALGLMGPAMPFDLTCASSLVAVHEAAGALHRGEVDLALAGGVNALLSPAVTKFMTKLGMLSASGRCRTFDAGADGYVRGEGCGILVLKRLAEAEAAGDRIWGVVRGSAMNQNGASAGLTVPNGAAQVSVIEEALSRAGVAPADVDYLEAHGTGSELGDPIEMQAAATVYGRGRDAGRPLLIGTVKTNIGHLEAAAGVAGIIKVVLAMRRGVIPKHLHFETPNPHLDWDRLPVRVTSQPTDWPLEGSRPPRAAVSAFGISGTNAHLVVEGYEAPHEAGGCADSASPEGAPRAVATPLPAPMSDLVPQAHGPRVTRILPLSGRSGDALRALARRYLVWLGERNGAPAKDYSVPQPLLADMAWTAGTGRSHFANRAGIVFHDAASLETGLCALADAEHAPGAREAGRTAFVYAGEGGQAAAVGQALYRSEPVAKMLFDRCDRVLREEQGASLLEWMFGASGPERIPGDPAIYALQCALTALWSSVGVRPSVVVGFGAGELAAAHAAGVLGLEEGLRLAVARDATAGREAEAGKTATAEDDLDAALSGIEFRPPSIALVSGVTGRVVAAEEMLETACGIRQAREPVAHRRCLRTVAERGIEVVVEIGPRGSVDPMIPSAWPDPETGAEETGTGIRGPVVLSGPGPADGGSFAVNGDAGFVQAVAAAYEAGLPIAFAGLFAGETRRRISVPGYPFERQRYWIESPKR